MPDPDLPSDLDWPQNYFNYFTEIEEHFQRVRGTGLFLLSPLDWALIESWKTAGIPLEAVLKGIDVAFEKWRNRKSKRRLINSLAYCAQAVFEAAQQNERPRRTAAEHPPFSAEEIRAHLAPAISALRIHTEPVLHELASSLDNISSTSETYVQDLEGLERRLTAIEDKIVAVLRTAQTEEELLAAREALDRELKPYRGKMTAEQLSMLERRYLETALLGRARLPRLSLFYLH